MMRPRRVTQSKMKRLTEEDRPSNVLPLLHKTYLVLGVPLLIMFKRMILRAMSIGQSCILHPPENAKECGLNKRKDSRHRRMTGCGTSVWGAHCPVLSRPGNRLSFGGDIYSDSLTRRPTKVFLCRLMSLLAMSDIKGAVHYPSFILFAG